jgi:hypothetical protein
MSVQHLVSDYRRLFQLRAEFEAAVGDRPEGLTEALKGVIERMTLGPIDFVERYEELALSLGGRFRFQIARALIVGAGGLNAAVEIRHPVFVPVMGRRIVGAINHNSEVNFLLWEYVRSLPAGSDEDLRTAHAAAASVGQASGIDPKLGDFFRFFSQVPPTERDLDLVRLVGPCWTVEAEENVPELRAFEAGRHLLLAANRANPEQQWVLEKAQKALKEGIHWMAHRPDAP